MADHITRGTTHPGSRDHLNHAKLPYLPLTPDAPLGHGSSCPPLHSYAALRPALAAPDLRSSQCNPVSTLRHFLAFLNYSRLNELKTTTPLVYLLEPRHSSNRTGSFRSEPNGRITVL